jgi:hypothetical protein
MKYLCSVIFCLAAFSIIAQQEFADCSNAVHLCDKTTYSIDQFNGSGTLLDETGETDCYGKSFPETNVAWFKWTVAKGGSVTFDIAPFAKEDDIDFVVFKSNLNSADCANKLPVRCMASGINFGLPEKESINCLGTTGLRSKSSDSFEKAGCKSSDDNFLKPLQVEPEETYFLFVNNLSSNEGFTLRFGGSAEFEKGVNSCAEEQITAGVIAVNPTPEFINIGEVFPNPSANNVIYLNIQSERTTAATVTVYGLNGQQIISPFLYALTAGTQTLEVNTENLRTGSYLIELLIDEEKIIRKFVVVKSRK